MKKNCSVCNNEYEIKNSKKDSKYCSRICKNKNNNFRGKKPHNANNSLLEAFNKQVIKNENGCWAIKNIKSKTITHNGKTLLANRVSWLLYNGYLPEKSYILKNCKNKHCVNPNHLFVEKKNLSRIEIYNKYVIKKETGCWEWSKVCDANGYGSIYYKGKSYRAHRQSYLIFKGKIPKNMCVLHKCDNPPCTNPQHLFLGTISDNVKDREEKQRGRFKKLKNVQINEILQLIKQNKSLRKICKIYNIGYRTLIKIKNNAYL